MYPLYDDHGGDSVLCMMTMVETVCPLYDDHSGDSVYSV